MAINKISEFPKVTPSADDKILIEKNGEGGHINLSEMPVSTPVNTKITGEVNSLKSRIDNIMASSGDDISEIVDARQGSDGTNYASLRARLDAENNQLKGDLASLIGEKASINTGSGLYDYYYYVNPSTKLMSKESNSDAKYFEPIDLSSYIGKNVFVKLNFVYNPGSSARAIALANTSTISSDTIACIYRLEKDFYENQILEFIPTEDNHYLYISHTKSNVSSIEVWYESNDGKIQVIEKNVEELQSYVPKLKEEYIQPHNFPTLPYKIIKNAIGYELEKPIYQLKGIDSFTQIYVDSVNGSDSNDGTSRNTAYKTLKKALTISIGKDSCINIIGDSVFYADDLYGEYPNRKSLAIIGENKPKLIHGDLPTWSIYNEDSNTYTATLTYTGKCCVDMGNIGLDGLYEGMKSVSDINTVLETENSYYIDGTTVYVHPISGNDATEIVVLKSGYGVRWNHSVSTTDHFLYMKNLNIIGGYYDVARSASYQVIGVNIEFFAEDCILQHNPNGDGFPDNGYDVSYNINCTVGFSQADCFNHHHSGCTTEQIQNSIIVDMNCKAREAGYYRNPKQGNDNLFTCHDGENVLRLNCRGMTAPGPGFADVNGCRSVLVDCESYNNSYSELNIDGAWQFNNVSAIRDGFVTLIGCRIYDSRNIVKLNSSCDIEMMDTPVFDSMKVSRKLSICNGI